MTQSRTFLARFKPLINRLLPFCAALVTSTGAMALEPGQALPSLAIDRAGALEVVDNKSRYSDWSTDSMTAEITLLQVLKASRTAADINMPFLDNFEDRYGGDQRIASVTIIDTNSIPSLLGGFVKRELKKNKQDHPEAIIVNDRAGTAAAAWSLPSAQAIIILLDAQQQVLLKQVGQIPLGEHEAWLGVIEEQLESGSRD